MALPQIHPLLLDEMIVLISSAFMKNFNADEQAVIGNILETLGSLISLNSSYILYAQGLNATQEPDQDDHNYELLEKSIAVIKEELNKMKETKQ